MNAALKSCDLIDTSFIVLAVLYGSLDETSTASELVQPCHEKPANPTRVGRQPPTCGLHVGNS
jgi:MarR family transcriptional repressor of emrRAB